MIAVEKGIEEKIIDRLISSKLRNKPKGSHGLHQDSFKLQTMTALIKAFAGGPKEGR